MRFPTAVWAGDDEPRRRIPLHPPNRCVEGIVCFGVGVQLPRAKRVLFQVANARHVTRPGKSFMAMARVKLPKVWMVWLVVVTS